MSIFFSVNMSLTAVSYTKLEEFAVPGLVKVHPKCYFFLCNGSCFIMHALINGQFAMIIDTAYCYE